MKYFFTACILFVVLALGVGLYYSGSPKEVRAQRLDEIRIADLATLQNNIAWYYRDLKKLPENIELLNRQNGVIAHMDPETKQPYEYHVQNELKFELCAHFLHQGGFDQEKGNFYQYSIPMPENGILQGANWQHSEGRFCFEREINPQYFKTQDGVVPVPIKGY